MFEFKVWKMVHETGSSPRNPNGQSVIAIKEEATPRWFVSPFLPLLTTSDNLGGDLLPLLIKPSCGRSLERCVVQLPFRVAFGPLPFPR